MAPHLLLFALIPAFAYGADFTVDLRSGQNQITPDKGISWQKEPSDPNNGDVTQAGCNWRGVLKLTFDKKTRPRATIVMQFDQPSQWAFNIGDSVTNDGSGADAGTQQRDAEVYSYDSDVIIAGSDKLDNNGSFGILHTEKNFINGNNITATVANQVFEAENGNRFMYFNSFKLFALRGQEDRDGDVNYDVYFGMNRVIANKENGVGSGLCRVEITMHRY